MAENANGTERMVGARERLFAVALILFAVLALAAAVAHFAFPDAIRKILSGEERYVTYKVQVVSQSLIVAGMLKPGDAQIGLDGAEKAVLVSHQVRQYREVLGSEFSGAVFAGEYVIVAEFDVTARVISGDVPRLGLTTLKPGDIFSFNTSGYVLWGTILSVKP